MVWKYAALITVALWSAPLVLSRQAGETEVQRQVAATDEQRIDALRRGDGAPLQQIYADDYTLVTPGGVIRSKAEVTERTAQQNG